LSSWNGSPVDASLLALPSSGEPVPPRSCLFSLYGKAELSAQEARGLALFNDGMPALDEREIDDLIVFLATLEDGWGVR
jgi:hypothetical protein